jgi:AcrR family transcriptional regulator
MGSTDDLTTAARIRDAAVRLVARSGWERVTLRQIAGEADVPVGLVHYHFGSKDGLRTACDDWVMQRVGEEKDLVLGRGPMPDLQNYAATRPEIRPLNDYIAMCLRNGGRVAQHVFDGMVDTTVELLAEGAEAGALRRYDDPRSAAILLVALGCGATLLGDHVARLFGGDDLLAPDVYRRYARTMIELFTHPMLVDERWLDALDAPPASGTDSPPAASEPHDPTEKDSR